MSEEPSGYEPLPLPHRRELGDAEALAAVEAFRDLMRQRHTVRDYETRAVPEEVIAAAIETAGRAPSGANQQPWHFAAVADPAVAPGGRFGTPTVMVNGVKMDLSNGDWLSRVTG